MEDVMRVVLSDDIHKRFNYIDYSKLPMHKARYWGAYLNGKIIALLVKVKLYHFYCIEEYRKHAKDCLELFERHHDMEFVVEDKFKDAVCFALQNGYRKSEDGVYRKCHS